MEVTILAFGIAKDILGGSSIKLEVKEKATVDDLKNFLEEKYPPLRQLASFRIALNNHFASSDEIISSGNEIAIIPPVSGG